METQAHRRADAQLKIASEDKAKLSQEVTELSQRLTAALGQIEELHTDLVTTRSLFENQGPPQQSVAPSMSCRHSDVSQLEQLMHQEQSAIFLVHRTADQPSTSEWPHRIPPNWEKPQSEIIPAAQEEDTSSEDFDGMQADFERQEPSSGRPVRGEQRGDCGSVRGCGSDQNQDEPTGRFNLSIKPRDPPFFSGKAHEDVDEWIQQVENFLFLIGGSPQMQVAYAANLLQKDAQRWYNRELREQRQPSTWRQLADALIGRFSNTTKEYAQSALTNMEQGKNKSAHEFAMRFEAVLDKIPHYDQAWVKNLFVWGLHPQIATTVSLKNPATLSRAI